MYRLTLPLLLVASLASADEPPKVLDPRLKLELIAEAPVVRTPTGIAIDDKGRVYVIESHTHFPPKDYDGPTSDRILRFEKKGEKWESSVFLEGKKHTMGCGFHPNGWLYIATRNLICRVKDKNDNGKIDLNEPGEHDCLVVHHTKGDYPHNGLSGFAFDYAGNVYFGQGENLGVDYQLSGQDGTKLSGGGEGGNVYCCDAEGNKLRRVATGFWNPFHLYLDPFGRLFAVDNDPDSRPPCRLLHVVEGGDYGYRFRNGRKGTHPFTSWNGELPGTLPMVSGTGEAPSGIIMYEHNWIDDFRGKLLVTSWGDHRIEMYEPKPRGASFSSEMKPVVLGGDNFRPVGIAEHPDGSVWFSDWVDKSYQLHGKGRLWRLSNPELDITGGVQRFWSPKQVRNRIAAGESDVKGLTAPRGPKEMQQLLRVLESDHEEFVLALGGSVGPVSEIELAYDESVLTGPRINREIRYAATRRLDPTKHRERLLELVGDPDPFIQQAARWALKPAADELARFEFSKEKRPGTRLGVALVLREANSEAGRKRIPELLSDEDPRVRFVAIQWIGEERLTDVWAEVRPNLEGQLRTRQEFEAYLATSAFIAGNYDPGKESPGEEFVVKMLLDEKTSPERQAFLLGMLRSDHPALTEQRLEQWYKSEDAAVRLRALQVISQRGTPPKFLNISELAQDVKRPVEERLEAISLLSPANPNYVPMLEKLAMNENALIAAQASRSLRVDAKAAGETASEPRPALDDLGAWKELLSAKPGDAKAGSYVFHHALAQCSRCHEVEGRGAAIGPNLTGIGKAMTRERLIQSVLQPSKEIAPQFAQWQLETTDGRILKGMYVGEEVDGTVIYANEQGQRFKLHPRDVESRTQVPLSIMPERLIQQLSVQEIRDLLAFLGSNP